MNFKELSNNFDNKLVILIIGDGNVGKSTLLNALVGKDVAKTSFLPTTWKIDVYSSQLSKDNAIIKYIGGKQEILSIEKARQKINEEEEKMQESNKIFKKKLNEEFKVIKNKKELEEIKMYLDKKYLYRSNICEVIWPVNSSWIPKSYVLVDTPGLNVQRNCSEKIESINKYYHKADSVIWVLNRSKISTLSPNILSKELDYTLKNLGGARDNIIGVINKIDFLYKNSGQEAVDKVYNDIVKYFGDKFTKIIPLSATDAYKGIINNDNYMIEQSGILDLKREIEHIFLSKANKANEKSKKKG